jgi:hypothetical protein
MDKNREILALEQYVAELGQDLARLQGSLHEARALRQDMVVTPLWPEAPPVPECDVPVLPPALAVAAVADVATLVRPDVPAAGAELALSPASHHVLSDPIPTFPF